MHFIYEGQVIKSENDLILCTFRVEGVVDRSSSLFNCSLINMEEIVITSLYFISFILDANWPVLFTASK